MNYFAPRTCREFQENASRTAPSTLSRPIESFQDTDAYVLLGAPGAGKTKLFEQEAKRTRGRYLTARDFMTFEGRAEWHDTTLYIDGLDEMRAGKKDGRTPLDRIRSKLDSLHRPRFRLSCRATDWLGANDRDHLKTVSPDGEVKVLYLDPLTIDDVHEILCQNYPHQNPDTFISSAKEKGVDFLLANPHSLELLMKAVEGSDWPDTRAKAFDIACLTLLKEHNQNHQASGLSVGVSSLMHAAGQLCAIQILTGKAGYTLPGNQDSDEFPDLEHVPGEDRNIFRFALGTRVFNTPDAGRACPVHRQIAEYLAARYLAGLVEDGLPPARILALVTGYDGGVVSNLRGLAAWLAACCKPCRRQIVQRDPLGTVLYGDVRNFSLGEKQELLKALHKEMEKNPWAIRAVQMDPRIGDIFTSDMEEVLQNALADSERNDARQAFVSLLMEMLTYGPSCPGLAPAIMSILRDETRWPGIRHRAVQAFVRHLDGNEAFVELTALAKDVAADRVSDPNDDLLGFLLEKLYPARLTASEVMQFLVTPKSISYTGKYKSFWTWHLPQNSTNDQLADLLDEFVAQRARLPCKTRKYQRSSFFMQRIPLVLLSRYLENSQKEVSSSQLFDWLGVALGVGDWGRETRFGGDEKEKIVDWLRIHPELWKSLFMTGLRRCLDSCKDENLPKFRRCMFMEERRVLLGIERPPDFWSWCLKQAMTTTEARAVEYFLKTARQEQPKEIIEARISGNPHLLSLLRKISAIDKGNNWNTYDRHVRDKHETYRKKIEAENHRKQLDWCERVNTHKAELEKNRGAPDLLHPLSVAYFGGYSDVSGRTPKARLQNLLGASQGLVETVLESFRGTVRREDLPTVSEIIELDAQNRIHLLTLPFMAGLEEITQSDTLDALPHHEPQLRLACAIRYTSPVWPRSGQLADSLPDWYERLLESHPDIVSDVLLSCLHAKLRRGTELRPALHNELTSLANSPEYADVARLTSLAALKIFPIRCTENQLSTLRKLLRAACLHAQLQQFLELIEEKLTCHSMNVAQRVCWLTGGLFASPGAYREKLHAYVTGKDRRISHLVEFLSDPNARLRVLAKRLDVPALQFLILLLGPTYQPFSLSADSKEGGAITLSMEMSMHVRGFINQLVSHKEMRAAKQALIELRDHEKLFPWQSYLSDAVEQQNTSYREAYFRHCSIQQAAEVLANRQPANAADLAALTKSLLKEISDIIHNGNTSDWRQYWNFDKHGKLWKPMHEDDCRDRLLSDLQTRLNKLAIDAQPEGRYADGKRADIRITYAGFNVPVEIKKSCHRDLWSALRKQLVAKYTRDPGTDGYGIYLVLWFGNTELCQPTPGTGPLPKFAGELEEQLRKELTSYEKRKISVCVVDVTKPSS